MSCVVDRPMHSEPAQEMGGTNAGTKEIADIYMCVHTYSGVYDWHVLKSNTNIKHPICKCGAEVNLKSPAFVKADKHRFHSSAVAVGNLIYVFGGFDRDKKVDCDEVSYIDTNSPLEGWKVCKNKMPKARQSPYPITLDDGRVLLVGGFLLQDGDRPYAQMYDPSNDSWVALECFPEDRPWSGVYGHAVVKEGGETIVLLHELSTRNLFTYNVNKDLWGTRWGTEFGESFHTGALVDGILYVLDAVTRGHPARVALCGYDVSMKHAKCQPVKILKGKKVKTKYWWAKERVPLPDDNDRLPSADLLPLGGNKLAMVWYGGFCFRRKVMRLRVLRSIFVMTKEKATGKLVARLSSHACYHVYNDGCNSFESLVPVFPSKCGPNEVLGTTANCTTN